MSRFDNFIFPKVLEQVHGYFKSEVAFKKLVNAHIFYVNYPEHRPSIGKRIGPETMQERIEQLSLPFPNVYLEQPGDICWRSHVADGPQKGATMGVPWIFFTENSATEIEALFLLTCLDQGTSIQPEFINIKLNLLDINWDNHRHCMAMIILDMFCTKLRNSQVGTEKIDRQIPVKFGHHKYSKSIGRIIRLKTKGEPVPTPAFARTIEWESAWFVRGHWRSFPGGLGKDRDGVYNQEGYTWVKHHIRGNPDVDPDKKIYVG